MEIQTLKKTYFGTEAETYDAVRVQQRIWPIEHMAVHDMLKTIVDSAGKSVRLLDIPVGTGRFFEHYKSLGCDVVGMDVSTDMLAQAKNEGDKIGFNAQLEIGDVLNISMPDGSVDVSLCVRLLNLFTFDKFTTAIKELSRVSKGDMICGVTVKPALGDISLGARLNVMARRIVTEIIERLRHGHNGFIRHSEKDVLRVFEEQKLTIVNRKRIDSGKGGYAYYIYHLNK